MDTHVCPWYLAYTFDNPIRKLIHKPDRILGPYVKPGYKVMDLGCGMGHFSLGMAGLVGPAGKVYAVDLQEKMLERVRKRAKRGGYDGTIEPTLCSRESIGVSEPLDFILACWVIHEIPDQEGLFGQLAGIMKPEARLLIAEPKFHVTEKELEESLGSAGAAGLTVLGKPRVGFSYTALLGKSKD